MGAVRALAGAWQAGEDGWWEGRKAGVRLGRDTDVSEPHTHFADTVSLRAVSAVPEAGGPEPRAAQPENGFASQPLSQPGTALETPAKVCCVLGPHERLKAGEPLELLRRREEKAQEEAEDTQLLSLPALRCLGRLRSDSCGKPSLWVPEDPLCCVCTWS